MSIPLIHEINRGNRKAFKVFFDSNYQALCAFAFRYLDGNVLVEDMVQDAFLSFWDVREQFDKIETAKAYLYTSVRNKCLNHIKHEEVKVKHEPYIVYELESEQFFNNEVIVNETFSHLYQEVRQLPAASQKIMLMVLDGMKNKEIAESLDVSENTVKTQKKIAYKKIKAGMGASFEALMLSF